MSIKTRKNKNKVVLLGIWRHSEFFRLAAALYCVSTGQKFNKIYNMKSSYGLRMQFFSISFPGSACVLATPSHHRAKLKNIFFIVPNWRTHLG